MIDYYRVPIQFDSSSSSSSSLDENLSGTRKLPDAHGCAKSP